MKKLLFVLGFIFALNLVYAQEDASIPGSDSEPSLPKKAFFINPLGFLQFGPVIGGEYRLGSGSTYLSPHVRFGYLGAAFYRLYGAGWMSPSSGGVGISIKNMLFTESDNVFYLGGGVEYNHYGMKMNLDDPIVESREDFQGLAAVANFGYRWRKKGMFYSLGLYGGLNNTLYYTHYYTSDNTEAGTGKSIYGIGMIEFSIGWEN